MAKYKQKLQEVDAVAFELTEEQKEKGLQFNDKFQGQAIAKDQKGVHLFVYGTRVNEGDWLILEEGQIVAVESKENFAKRYEEVGG